VGSVARPQLNNDTTLWSLITCFTNKNTQTQHVWNWIRILTNHNASSNHTYLRAFKAEQRIYYFHIHWGTIRSIDPMSLNLVLAFHHVVAVGVNFNIEW